MVEEKLRELIVERYGSMIAFSKSIGMPNSTLATIMERGVKKASINNIIKICEALGVSADGLAHGRIIYNKKPGEIPVMTVEALIEEIQKFVLENNNLILNGAKMTEEEKESLANAVGLSLEIMKMQNKRQKQI